MFLEYLFFYTFIIIGLINVLHFGMYLIGANLYDILRFKTPKVKAPRLRVQPLVTVLIPAHNEEKSIIRCLDSVRRSTHRKLQIIVIDDASTDGTRQLVRRYKEKYAKRNIILSYKIKNVGKAGALNHALKRYAKGKYIMTLDADSILDKHAIKNALAYFKNPTIAGVAANVRIADSTTPIGILQKMEHMIGYRSKKFYSLTNSEFIIGGVASTYRASVLNKVKFYDYDTATEDIGLSLKIVSLGNNDYRLCYGVDVLAQTEGVHTFKDLLKQRYRWKMGMLQNLIKFKNLQLNQGSGFSRSLTFYRLPMAILSEFTLLIEPILVAYILIIALQLHTPTVFLGAYLTITAYVFWTILPDEHSSWTKKLELSAYAPFMYFAFYIMSGIQLVSIIRCLINPKKLLVRDNTAGRWISPKRWSQTTV